MMNNRCCYVLAVAACLLSACKGDYDGSVSGTSGGAGGSGGNTQFSNSEEFFKARAQPRLDFCRTCHTPGGVGDVPDGKLFMLSSNKSEDLSNLRASWERLGKNASPPSRILKMPSGTDARSHTGGTPWPKNSDAYKDMAVMLSCFDDPVECLKQIAGGIIGTELPLLGSARGGHLWDSFCEGKPDDALLPPDPRSLVVPGVNPDKAVYFNAFWQTCRPGAEPKTCGEQRGHVARGKTLIAGNGALGAGHEFAGDASASLFAVPASTYNNLWQRWGLSSRPENFDQLVEERYGSALSPERNPYPLPGEDPNQTSGGSGQLPTALTQLRNADGSWSGSLGVTCSVCHSGQVGSAADGPGLGSMYGSNSLHDITVLFTELGGAHTQLAITSLNRTRGTGNITNFQLFAILELTDPVTLAGQNPLFWLAPSTGTEDPPVWWNVGHRPLKFYDGGLPVDATRIELSFYYPNAGLQDTEGARAWVIEHEQDSTSWLASLKSPPYPGSIDTALAEQGAILFHSKNLWEPALNNPVRKSDGGNGSCASCHGAYSPRYVNDPAYLDTPALEGIAAYIVPNAVIGTDRARVDGNNQAVSDSARSSWFAYRDQPQCGDQNDIALRGSRELGYLAPPLYGVWATAPYFHNGAVPNVWETLKPADRQPLWRRVSKPPLPGQENVVMGFDTNIARAYDADNMGWKYETLACGAGTIPYLDCDPSGADPLVQQLLSLLYANGGLLWNIANLPILTDQQIEQRKIYNTYMYSQSNDGHEFTAVLTDNERRAIIEYLKTL